jgi:hypothetical protein
LFLFARTIESSYHTQKREDAKETGALARQLECQPIRNPNALHGQSLHQAQSMHNKIEGTPALPECEQKILTHQSVSIEHFAPMLGSF